ncbi:nicotinate-nicotinamide nucleotide adenylyltransferase [Psychrobacter sp. K31L]|uniref:nicotinate-nicotinamide nucleotide adenylyltransferase n=1 Tax=Psychrobacter sp. K31L TaxID=2820758 RepID=UPI001B3444B5|nr:nicotinate-nicotinamide nucleotide adenylyltransferase [Psychrobacter sp. K31L]MBP3947193.1 nicotinate-nicotinamide nucleotide adenylyltransferase [Psychrobacter sp. K31L]
MPNLTNDCLAENTAPAIRAYLGGSFDPVHKGHLQMAIYVYQHLLPIAKQQQRALHVSLLPNARSPFKNESTNPKHRLAMLKLATLNTPLQIDELELWQAPPVYTIDSVRTLRQRYPHDSLIFIMGMDSARSLDKWKDGLKLKDYVDLWVFNRGGFSDSDDHLFDINTHLADKKSTMQTLANLKNQLHAQLPIEMQNKTTDSPAELVALFTPTPTQTQADSGVLKNPHQGHIYIDPRPISAISSTQIRQQLQQLGNQPNIMPSAEAQITSIPSINDIIGNTESNPFAKWLNPAIYQYIIAHQLYSAAQFR